MNYCRKVRFQTEDDAKAGVETTRQWLARKESPARLALLSHYWCEDCRAWHVGHQTPRYGAPVEPLRDHGEQ